MMEISAMIQCDGCKHTTYADSRGAKYHEIWIDRSESYHLCETCYDALMRNILHMTFDTENFCWVERGKKRAPD